jgi:hypothetical protein
MPLRRTGRRAGLGKSRHETFPGFRDDLEAAGLLDCKLVPLTTPAARPVVGKPFEFCFQDPPRR